MSSERERPRAGAAAATPIPWMSDDDAARLPWLTVAQMVELDRAMVEDHFPQAIDPANRQIADTTRENSVIVPRPEDGGGRIRMREAGKLAVSERHRHRGAAEPRPTRKTS